jgi:hypothetical protein
MIWYKKLGFSNNPFSIKPAAYQPNMIAYDLDYIYSKIDNAEIMFIEGDYGTGKTTILKNIILKYKGKNRIVYFSFNDGVEFNIHQLLEGANTFIGKLTGLKVRNIILLLDEVHLMSKKEAMSVLKYYESGVIKSMVMVSHDYESTSIPEDVQAYLKDNVIKTASLNLTEAEELISSRIGEIGLFPKPIIRRVFALADKNPRRFLAYCEDIARYAVEMDDFKIADFHVDAVLGEAVKQEQKRIQKPKKTKETRETPAPAEPAIKVQELSDVPPAPAPVKMPAPEKHIPAKKEHPPEPPAEESLSDAERLEAEDLKHKERQKKYKVNRLVEGTKEPLGTVEAKEPESRLETEEEIPEYKVFVFDK